MGSGKLVAVEATTRQFRGELKKDPWTLCIGAGISRGVLPDWQELARNVVNECFATRFDEVAFAAIVRESGWTLDAWIQAASNEYLDRGKTRGEFVELIEAQLYSRLMENAKRKGMEKLLTHALNYSKAMADPEHVEAICAFFEREFAQCSLLHVANLLLDTHEAGCAPRAVLNFNADTLLETLVFMLQKLRHQKKHGASGSLVPAYHAIQRTTDNARSSIPIYHCHGVIAPRESDSRDPRDSRDRLVFLEEEYLRVASVPAMWPASVFLLHAQTTRMVFLGLSMSDPNIRRWMSAAYEEKQRDLKQFTNGEMRNPPHLWLLKRPATEEEARIKLVSLTHLGIRPAWISEWDHVRAGMRNLLVIGDAPAA